MGQIRRYVDMKKIQGQGGKIQVQEADVKGSLMITHYLTPPGPGFDGEGTVP